jgi:hypothetical protein
MATSQVTLFEREEDLIFFQDHTIPGDKVATIQALAAERGWRMDLGPVDESTDRISAAVGAMWNPGRVKIHIAALSTREGRDFEKIGRLKKYSVQFVQGNPFTVYNIYAWVSGAQDQMANRRTNLMMDEIRKDAQIIKNQPYLITGDLIGLPQDFDVLAKMCAQGDLQAVGALGTIAGADKDGPTCCTAAQEEGNRKDFVLASTAALPLVASLSIDKEGTFPTHKPVMTELRTNALKTGAKMKVPVLDLEEYMPRDEKGKLDIWRMRAAVDIAIMARERDLERRRTRPNSGRSSRTRRKRALSDSLRMSSSEGPLKEGADTG